MNCFPWQSDLHLKEESIFFMFLTQEENHFHHQLLIRWLKILADIAQTFKLI